MSTTASMLQRSEALVIDIDLDFKQFFVSLVEAAYREGQSLEEIYSDIAKLKTELVIPDMENLPLKEWALQTFGLWRSAMPKTNPRWLFAPCVAKLPLTANPTAPASAPTVLRKFITAVVK